MFYEVNPFDSLRIEVSEFRFQKKRNGTPRTETRNLNTGHIGCGRQAALGIAY